MCFRYFEFEADAGVFLENGERKPKNGNDYNYARNMQNTTDPSVLDIMDKRKRDYEYAEIANTKKLVYPKPYIPGIDGQGASPMDKRRVFAKVITVIPWLRQL